MAEPRNTPLPTNDHTLVSVVIVNYNGLRFLETCLESLAQAFTSYRSEIIVVDNASSDGSQEWLKARKDIVYVESTVNTGFTGGNNLGAQYAHGDRLLFINNDTYVVSPLDPMIALLDAPDVGIAACRLQYGDQRQQFSFGFDHSPLRIVLSWLGLEKRHSLPKIFRRLETDASTYLRDQANLDWVSGACFAIRTADWNSVDGFDTGFFMYCEDVDLCLRVRELGLRIAYTASCLVTHYEGAGKSWIGSAALKRTVRSYQILTKKHHGLGSAILVSLCLGALFLLRAALFGVLSLVNRTKRKVRAEKSAGFAKSAVLLLTSLTPSAMKAPNP
jgi:GT2 family glycosyltransferase